MASDQHELGESLAAWAGREFGGHVRLHGEVTTNGVGFDSDVFFLRLIGDRLPAPWSGPLVLRIKPTVDALEVARSEAAIQDWVADAGYPTPRVLHVFAPGELADRPTQVMSRAPGHMALDLVRSGPWRVRGIIDRLAEQHVRLHELDPTGFPVDVDLFDRRLGLARHVAARLQDESLLDGLRRVEAIANRLRHAEPVVCHGDFHPLNAIVDGDEMTIIDWTDAGIGDRHGDAARTMLLMELAWIAASSPTEERILRIIGPTLSRWYGAAYRRRRPLEQHRLALWRPVHLLHGWSQAIGAHHGLFDGDAPNPASPPSRGPSALADELRRQFEEELSAVE